MHFSKGPPEPSKLGLKELLLAMLTCMSSFAEGPVGGACHNPLPETARVGWVV